MAGIETFANFLFFFLICKSSFGYVVVCFANLGFIFDTGSWLTMMEQDNLEQKYKDPFFNQANSGMFFLYFILLQINFRPDIVSTSIYSVELY